MCPKLSKNESESIINQTEIEIEEIKNNKSPFDL